jgi:hypothetical protein
MQFARDLRTRKLPSQNLIVCDESRFCVGPDNRWLWRRRRESVEDVLAPAAKYSKISLHLWGAIGVGFKSCLIVFVKNVDSDVYIESLNGDQFFEPTISDHDLIAILHYRSISLYKLDLMRSACAHLQWLPHLAQ